MSKRLRLLLLCAVMFFSTLASISANEKGSAISIDTNSITRSARSYEPVIPDRFMTMDPGKTDFQIVSVSASEHSFLARRLENGNVQLLIYQKWLTTRCYYQHLATDVNGEYFIPEKDVYFFIENPPGQSGDNSVYSVEFSKDAVSKDGYIYLEFAIQPQGGNQQFAKTYYKVPVQ